MKKYMEYIKSLSIPKKVLFLIDIVLFVIINIYYIIPNISYCFNEILDYPSSYSLITFFAFLLVISMLFLIMILFRKINYPLLLISLFLMIIYIPFTFILVLCEISP